MGLGEEDLFFLLSLPHLTNNIATALYRSISSLIIGHQTLSLFSNPRSFEIRSGNLN
jgi:hypothetical protein